MGVDVISFGYAALVATGGVIGYVKAGSSVSLAMGMIFGGILGFGAYQHSMDPANYHVMLIGSTVLGGVMGYRFYNTGKFMPAGLLAALSLMMILRFATKSLR